MVGELLNFIKKNQEYIKYTFFIKTKKPNYL